MSHNPFRRPFWSRADEGVELPSPAPSLPPPPSAKALQVTEPIKRSPPVPHGLGPDTAEFLTTKEAAVVVRLSPRTLERLRLTGDGPKYLKLGGPKKKRGRILYRRADLLEWMQRAEFCSTSEYAKQIDSE